LIEVKKECKRKRTDKKISIQDKKAKSKAKITFVNENQRSIDEINLDCVFKELEKEQRCDGLLVDNSKEKFVELKYFVELKGSNIDKAIMQLENTIKLLGLGTETTSFVIFSGSPNFNTKLQTQKNKFEGNTNSKLLIQRTGCEFDLDKRKFL